ncbi:MAG: hypothetical protein VX127_06655 [Myxococcota bacterium]|nr:hypothetical protein [Myxococcota bacterium]
MNLTPLELSRLKAEDGLASSEDIDRVDQAGIDREADGLLRASIKAALRSNPPLEVADGVMRRIGSVPLPLGDAIRQEPHTTVADAVMASLGGGQASPIPVRQALTGEAGIPDALWPSIAAAVGADPGMHIGKRLRSEVEQESAFRGQVWLTPRRRWAVGGAALACAAAAAFLIGVGITNTPVGPAASAAISPILDAPVDIEELEVGMSSSVQVLQFGNDAPTIIFVSDDLEGAQ